MNEMPINLIKLWAECIIKLEGRCSVAATLFEQAHGNYVSCTMTSISGSYSCPFQKGILGSCGDTKRTALEYLNRRKKISKLRKLVKERSINNSIKQ